MNAIYRFRDFLKKSCSYYNKPYDAIRKMFYDRILKRLRKFTHINQKKIYSAPDNKRGNEISSEILLKNPVNTRKIKIQT